MAGIEAVDIAAAKATGTFCKTIYSPEYTPYNVVALTPVPIAA